MNKFYYIFEKEKLTKYIHDLWNDKPDLSWIGYFTAIIGLITLIIKTTASKPFVTVDTVIITVSSIFIIFLTYHLFISFNKWLSNKHKHKNFDEYLSKISIEQDYTHLFIIKINIQNEAFILVENDIFTGFWLPYISKNNEDIDKIEFLETLEKRFNFKLNINELKDKDLENILKEKPNKGYSKISYKFYTLEFYTEYHTFKNQFLSKNNKYKFISLNEMKDDILTIKTNFDIITHLEQIGIENLPNSFGKTKLNDKLNNLKVIWNITKKCEYDCAFCATDSGNKKNNNELSFEQRIKIAEELKKINGLRLDIAGGDPLYDEEVVNTIKHISKYMIKDLTVTTTGLAIKNYSGGNIKKIYSIADEYDISYDYPAQWDEHHRGTKYNKTNYEYISYLLNNGLKVNILVTLSEHNTKNESIINQMIHEIKNLNATSITLLRLIPVGRQDYNEYPKNIESYNPLLAIKLFKKAFSSNLKLHCAFRPHIESKKNYCNMLTEKIGVDNLGNVYSCAWTGYLKVDNVDNPFYLGNLLENTIEEIFNSEKYLKLYDAILDKKIQFCPIFSFLENESNFLSNNDKFSEWYVENKIK